MIELHRGDVIKVQGQTVALGDILFQHVNTGNDHMKAFADVEFRDSNGNYRHYQSWSDGGEIQLKNGTVIKFERK